MHVGTHFFAGWLVSAAVPGLTRRERGLVTFAGVAPDIDGLGFIVEEATANASHPLPWYSLYHHILCHNLGFALAVTVMAYALAKRRVAVALLAFLSFHLHLLFDLMGSRGSDGYQWPIPYLAPFSSAWQLTWSGQWWVGAWQNTLATFIFVFATVYLAWRLGYSPVGLFSPKADVAFVTALRARFGVPRAAKVVVAALLVLCAAGSATAQGLPAGRAAALGFAPDRLRRLDSVIQAYVDEGRVPGVVALVARHGHIVYASAHGMADREAGRRMTSDALFRIASQTKAVTSVAVMILVEEGKLQLSNSVARFVPSFAGATVASGSDTGLVRTRVQRPITIRDLLTHTAGITYGTGSFEHDTLVPALYRAAGLGPAAGWGWYFADKTEPVCTTIDRLGTLPFYAQPGRQFVYGYNTDILGCVVERVSGQSLDDFITSRILTPLRMHDTHFFVSPAQRDRLTAVYAERDGGRIERAPDGSMGQGHYVDGPRVSFSGGAGLVSTAGDYARFLQMMLNGGALDGARILSPRTVALMTSDQIDSVYGERGYGFGLGFAILENPGLAGEPGAPGRYGWGGAYGTTYWVDPAEDLVAVFMIQVLPRRALDLAAKFRTMVYAAITGR